MRGLGLGGLAVWLVTESLHEFCIVHVSCVSSVEVALRDDAGGAPVATAALQQAVRQACRGWCVGMASIEGH